MIALRVALSPLCRTAACQTAARGRKRPWVLWNWHEVLQAQQWWPPGMLAALRTPRPGWTLAACRARPWRPRWHAGVWLWIDSGGPSAREDDKASAMITCTARRISPGPMIASSLAKLYHWRVTRNNEMLSLDTGKTWCCASAGDNIEARVNLGVEPGSSYIRRRGVGHRLCTNVTLLQCRRRHASHAHTPSLTSGGTSSTRDRASETTD